MTAADRRDFQTQSSRSRSAKEEAPTTMPMTASRSRTATTAESTQRMATERQRRLDQARLLAQQEGVSSDMACYSRLRFVATCDAERTSAMSTPAAAALVSKCHLSPYATVVMETPAPTPRPPAGSSGERQAGQQRARLMNELRLRQAEQPARYRHDRTAQELAQEGSLTGRDRVAAGRYPWPLAYKYTPFPQPRMVGWLATERRLAAKAADSARAAEAEAAADAEAAMIEMAVQVPRVALKLPTLTLLQQSGSDGEHSPQHQRKASDSLLRPAGSSLVPAGGSGGKWQRSKSQATVQKHQQRSGRLFSVSTIGDEERSRRRAQLQTLAKICQRLRNRRAAAVEAAAEAAAASTAGSGDAVDQLIDEIECGGPLYRSAAQAEEEEGGQDQVPLPEMPCPGSEAKSRQHQTRVWLYRHRFCGIGPPPLIS